MRTVPCRSICPFSSYDSEAAIPELSSMSSEAVYNTVFRWTNLDRNLVVILLLNKYPIYFVMTSIQKCLRYPSNQKLY